MRIEGAALAALLATAGPAAAQRGVLPTTITVGGAAMVSDRDILENLSRSSDHQVFMALMHSAGLAEMLRQHGPFTVFAPTDAAFAALPAGALDAMRLPDNRAGLVRLLQAHILPGDYSSARMRSMMRSSHNGQAELEDIAEGTVTVSANGPSNLALHDGRGALADITLYDVKQANGVVFVIDRVLSPG